MSINKVFGVKVSSMFFVLTLLLLVFTNTSKASTINEFAIQEDVENMRKNYTELGIDEEVGEKLIQKVLNGELLDSHNPNKQNEVDLIVEIGEKGYFEFEDGSRIMLSVEEPEPLFSTFGASTGTTSNSNCVAGSGYRTCTVTARYYDMVWDLKFDTNVTYANGGATTMTNARNYRANLVLYGYSHKNIKVTRSKSTSTQPARSQWEANFTHKTGLYSVDRTLALYASPTSTYARLEWD